MVNFYRSTKIVGNQDALWLLISIFHGQQLQKRARYKSNISLYPTRFIFVNIL